MFALIAASMTLHSVAESEADFVAARVIVAAYLAIAASIGAYTVPVGLKARQSVSAAFRAVVATMILFVVLTFALKISDHFSRLFLSFAAIYALFMLLTFRVWVAHHARVLGGNPWETILICDAVDDFSLPLGCSVILHTDNLLDPAQRTPEMFDRLARTIGHADRVIVRCPPDRRRIWTAVLRGLNTKGEIEMPELTDLSPQSISYTGRDPTLVIAQGPLNMRDRIIKRLMDVMISGGALLLLAPVLIAIALAIRLTGPGPVLFKQTRLGRQNQKFTMLKFRSMRVEQSDEGGARSASRDDGRITPVGRLLRRTSADELPQLLNVLRGDMSIVGPRPHALSSTAADLLFWEVNPNYWDRHVIKPGLTGLAQVRGYRGATLEPEDLQRRLTADMEYIRAWSPMLDVAILLRTMGVLVHHNAY